MKAFILKNQKNVRKLNPKQAEARMYNKGKNRKILEKINEMN